MSVAGIFSYEEAAPIENCLMNSMESLRENIISLPTECQKQIWQGVLAKMKVLLIFIKWEEVLQIALGNIENKTFGGQPTPAVLVYYCLYANAYERTTCNSFVDILT